MVPRAGFEPAKAAPAVLQTASFDQAWIPRDGGEADVLFDSARDDQAVSAVTAQTSSGALGRGGVSW
jgi:hypothetical protein